jgi:non-specific serine/threonine protein kinase/serine/threonine-protein kinase
MSDLAWAFRNAMSLLGASLLGQGRFEEADPFLIEASMRIEPAGVWQHRKREALERVVALYTARSKPTEAARYEDEQTRRRLILGFRERVLGQDHPDTFQAMLDPGIFLRSQGRASEAETLLKRTGELRRRSLGDRHPHTIQALFELGLFYRGQGRASEAAPILEQTLERRRRVLGELHPDTLWSMRNLSVTLRDLERYDEAESMTRAALEASRRVLGEDHRDTLHSMTDLAAILHARGRADMALKTLGELSQHSKVTDWMLNNYAWLLLTVEPVELRDPVTALEAARRANEMSGYDEPAQLDTLALAHHHTDATAKAIELQRQALELLPVDAPWREECETRLAEFEAALESTALEGSGESGSGSQP